MEQHELDAFPDGSSHQQHPISSSPHITHGQSTATPLKLFIIIGSLYLGTFLVALDTTIIGTAVPAITAEFHALDDLAWYGSAYLLALTALQPTFGKLYKVVHTKRLYLGCIAVFESELLP